MGFTFVNSIRGVEGSLYSSRSQDSSNTSEHIQVSCGLSEEVLRDYTGPAPKERHAIARHASAGSASPIDVPRPSGATTPNTGWQRKVRFILQPVPQNLRRDCSI